MRVSPKTFFKQASLTAVYLLLENCGIYEIRQIIAETEEDERVQRILDTINSVDNVVRDRVFATIDQIEQLKSDTGYRALRSVALAADVSAERFNAFEDIRAAAIHMLVETPEVFSRALTACYADNFYGGRSWRAFRYRSDSEVVVRSEPAARRAFEAKAREAFSDDPLNRYCKIDWFDRIVEDRETRHARKVTQAAVFQERRPRVESVFTDAETVKSLTRRPVLEGAIVFDPETGDLDILAKGGQRLHKAIAESFRETMIAGEVQATPVEMRALDLSSLARERDFEVRIEDGIESVSVEKLKIVGPDTRGLAVTFETRQSLLDDGSIHERIANAFAPHAPVGRAGWTVVWAQLLIVFRSEEGSRKSKAIRVDLSLPNKTSLRDQTEQHRLIGQILLDRWGLYRDERD